MANVIHITGFNGAYFSVDTEDFDSGNTYLKRGPLSEDELSHLADMYTSILLDGEDTQAEADDAGDAADACCNFLTYMRVRGYDDARDPDFCATALTAGGHAPWKAAFPCNPCLPISEAGENDAIPCCDGGGTLEPPDELN